MQKLDEKTWAPVGLTSMFDLQRGRESNMAMLEDGDVPLISAKNGSNGLKGFVKTSKRLINGECISLNNDGDGGAGLAYYQPANMALDTHVTALLPKDDMGRDAMLFTSECISGLHGFFGHGLSISNPRAKAISVMLPVTEDGEPDYGYMDCYASEMRGGLLMRYKNYVAGRLSELKHKDIPALDEKEWAEFMMNDIFIIGHGFYNKKPPMYENGEIPFIGASDSHNGVTGFTHIVDIERSSKTGNPPNEAIERKLFEGPCIVVTNNGSVGYAYYHISTFTCTHDVNPLWLRNGRLSEPLAHFLGCCIHKQAVCFEYARKWRPKRMVHSRIMLPVNVAGEPDFEYMEQYSKNMMLRKYQQYLAFLDTKK